MDSRPEPPPEAVLIRVARKAAGKTLTETALAAGVSKAWLSAIEGGSQARDGATIAVTGSDSYIARIAAFLGITAQELDDAGRTDAGRVLREILRRRESAVQADDRPDDVKDNWSDEIVRLLWEKTRHLPMQERMGRIRGYLAGKAANGDDDVSKGA